MDRKNYESPHLQVVEIEVEQAILQASDTTINGYPNLFNPEEEI